MRKKLLAFVLMGVIAFSGSNVSLAAGGTADVANEQIAYTCDFANPCYQEISYACSAVNPVYAGAEDGATQESDGNASSPSISLLADPEYTTDTEEIVATITEAMIARAPQVVVYYKTKEYSNELANTWYNTWLNAALEESDHPYGGDYLRWSFKKAGMGISGKYSKKEKTYYLAIAFSFEYYTDADQEEELQEAVEDVLEELQIDQLDEDYLKVKAIYDYICDNVSYDYDQLYNEEYTLKYTAYAALINKTAVCQGYATLLYAMLEQAGIDTRVIAGLGNGSGDSWENHAWNIVELEDQYYLCDATWDHNRAVYDVEYDYFLKGNDDFVKHVASQEYQTEAFQEVYPIPDTKYVYVPKPVATAIEIYGWDKCFAIEEEEATLGVTFAPTDAKVEAITWTSSDEELARVDKDGNVVFCDEGLVTITATSKNGLTDAIEVLVIDPDDIELEEVERDDVDEQEMDHYKFVPAETGKYTVFTKNNTAFTLSWYDENYTYIEGASGKNIEHTASLEAGKTYYICLANDGTKDIEYSIWIETWKEPEYIQGDVSGDNKINVRDVMKLKEYIADPDRVSVNTLAADMDGNGKLNVRDVMRLKEFIANN